MVIETNKDGTLKSANIAEVNWTDKQREFVEKCLRAAAEQGRNAERAGTSAKQDNGQGQRTEAFLRENSQSLATGSYTERKPTPGEIKEVEALDEKVVADNEAARHLSEVRRRMDEVESGRLEDNVESVKEFTPDRKRTPRELSGRTGTVPVRISQNPAGTNIKTDGRTGK